MKSLVTLILLTGIAFAADAMATPQLLLFWRGDCAPCRRELSLLPVVRAQHPHLSITVMALRERDVVQLAGHLPPQVKLARTAKDAQALFVHYGNGATALPFSVMLHADNRVCATHTGIVGTDRIDEWVETC